MPLNQAENLKQINFETVTVGATAVSLTTATLAGAVYAQVYVSDARIRYTCSGTPTASSGAPADIGDIIEIFEMSDITGFKAIREGSTSAKIDVLYFGR